MEAAVGVHHVKLLLKRISPAVKWAIKDWPARLK